MKHTTKITTLLLLMLLIGRTCIAHGGKDPVFTMSIKLEVNKGDSKNSIITITRNGETFKSLDGGAGVQSVDFDLSANYSIVFAKEGYITKQVDLNTKVPNKREKGGFAKFKCVIELFPQPEQGTVTYPEPVGKIKFSEKLDDFDYDHKYEKTADDMQHEASLHPVYNYKK